MQTNNILSAPLIDLIFDGRNKDYGAYELRSSYEKRIKKALFITVTVTALAIGGAAIAGSLKKDNPRFVIRDGHTIVALPDEKKDDPIVETKKKPVEQQVQTQKYTKMVIVEDEKVTEPPTEVPDLADSQIGLVKKDGEIFEGIATTAEIGDNRGIIEAKPQEKNDNPLSIVELEAKFTGNWESFLRKNLDPEVPIDNNAPAGTYSIVIQFVVDREGNVSEIKPLTNHGFGMEQEAVRVLKKATKWEPAIQNGYPVKAYRRQPITFQVLEE